MNELQQVLIAFAVIVLLGLYIFSRKKPTENKPENESEHESEHESENELTAAKNSSKNTAASKQPGLVKPEDTVPENQGVLPFEEFQLEAFSLEPETAQQAENPAEQQHKTLEIDDLMHESELEQQPEPKKLEPEIFAILVQTTSTETLKMQDLDKLFNSLDLVFNDQQQIYVKKYLGKTVLYVANILNPGTFPADVNAEIITPGVALVTQLPPATISATKAVEEMIWTARRISQELKGRLYDQNRKILSESDLKTMQDRAKLFETSNVDNILR